MLYVFRAMSATRRPYISLPLYKRLKILGWYLVEGCIRGQMCVTRKNRVDTTFDLETEIPFRSVSPKQIKIFGWYLVRGCIRGQRCVALKNRVDLSFDLDPVTLKPKFPSALYLPSESRFLVDIWCEDVSGDKGVSCKIFVSMWPLTLNPNCILFPFRSIIPKQLKIFGWYLVGGYIRGQRCVTRKNRVDATFRLYPVSFKLKFPSALNLLTEWKVLVDISCIRRQRCVAQKIIVDLTLTPNNNSLPLYYSWTTDDIWWENISVDEGVSLGRMVSMWPLILTLWPSNQNSLPLCIS
jgi:hypothetical protein